MANIEAQWNPFQFFQAILRLTYPNLLLFKYSNEKLEVNLHPVTVGDGRTGGWPVSVNKYRKTLMARVLLKQHTLRGNPLRLNFVCFTGQAGGLRPRTGKKNKFLTTPMHPLYNLT
jgi:hypothetical protein